LNLTFGSALLRGSLFLVRKKSNQKKRAFGLRGGNWNQKQKQQQRHGAKRRRFCFCSGFCFRPPLASRASQGLTDRPRRGRGTMPKPFCRAKDGASESPDRTEKRRAPGDSFIVFRRSAGACFL